MSSFRVTVPQGFHALGVAFDRLALDLHFHWEPFTVPFQENGQLRQHISRLSPLMPTQFGKRLLCQPTRLYTLFLLDTHHRLD